MFILLFVNLACTLDFHVSTKAYSMVLSDDVNDWSQGLTAVSPLSDRISTDTSMTLTKQKAGDKHEKLLFLEEYGSYKGIYFLTFNKNLKHYQNEGATSNFYDSNSRLDQNNVKHRGATFTSSNLLLLKFVSDLAGKERKSSEGVFKRLQKRNAVDDYTRNASRGKQKKAKALGRLLLNNVSSKNYDDIQDDYIEDEDDDYFRGVNGKKMNWEDYQNEDGASVMELIALNARHKKYMRRTDNN